MYSNIAYGNARVKLYKRRNILKEELTIKNIFKENIKIEYYIQRFLASIFWKNEKTKIWNRKMMLVAIALSRINA